MSSQIQLSCLALLALCVAASMQLPYDEPKVVTRAWRNKRADEEGSSSEAPIEPGSSESALTTDAPDDNDKGSPGEDKDKGSGGKFPGGGFIDKLTEPFEFIKDTPAGGFINFSKPWIKPWYELASKTGDDIPGRRFFD